MKKQKFYAVRVGRKSAIFTNWNECEKQIQGYQGAKYKSFYSMDEAVNYMNNNSDNLQSINIQEPLESSNKTIHAYVDGSFDSISNSYSCGIVCLLNGKEFNFSDVGNNAELSGMRNVAGELMGAMRAIAFSLKNLEVVDTLVIYHDYEGVAKWCTGEWKAKKMGTQKYKAYYDNAIKKINIKFVKVKAHSGVKYNELADKLAKNALQQN